MSQLHSYIKQYHSHIFIRSFLKLIIQKLGSVPLLIALSIQVTAAYTRIYSLKSLHLLPVYPHSYSAQSNSKMQAGRKFNWVVHLLANNSSHKKSQPIKIKNLIKHTIINKFQLVIIQVDIPIQELKVMQELIFCKKINKK